MPSILLFLNLKGGVAKTTNAVAVAECLASRGFRTLLIDADHQCMSGELLLGQNRLLRCENQKKTLHDLLAAMLDEDFDPNKIPRFVHTWASDIDGGLENLSVIPCSVRIDDFQTNMAKARKGHRTNEEFLACFQQRRIIFGRWLRSNYDYTIVDCPPSIALQVKAFLSTADAFIVPTIPDRLSVRGATILLDRIARNRLKIRGLGTLWSLYRDQNSIHRRIIEATARGEEPYDQLLLPFETIIPNATAITEASEPNTIHHSFKAKYRPIFSRLFSSLCDEIIDRCEAASTRPPLAHCELAGAR
jgi:chromosome partitioning protein